MPDVILEYFVNQYVPAQHNIEQAIANDVEHIEYTVGYINQDRMLHAENELRPCCRDESIETFTYGKVFS